jgi:hypothetical protein
MLFITFIFVFLLFIEVVVGLSCSICGTFAFVSTNVEELLPDRMLWRVAILDIRLKQRLVRDRPASGNCLGWTLWVVGGDAATANVKSPRRRLPTRAWPANSRGAGDSWRSRVSLFHFGNWEVRERDLLSVDGVPIAVVAEHGRCTVGMNLLVPDLELLG